MQHVKAFVIFTVLSNFHFPALPREEKYYFCPFGRYLKQKIQYYSPTSAVHPILPLLISQILKLALLFNYRKTFYIVIIFSSFRRYENKAMPTYTLLRSVWGLPTVACRRLTPFPSETRSTSTPEFFLRKTKNRIDIFAIHLLVENLNSY